MSDTPAQSIELVRPTLLDRLAVATIIIAVPLLSLISAYLMPVARGPDEGDHMDHVLYLAENARLPNPSHENVGQIQHPPLPYAIMACWVKACLAIDDRIDDSFFEDRDFTGVAGRITTFQPGHSYAEHFGLKKEQAAEYLELLEKKGESSPTTRKLTLVVHRTWIDRAARIPSIILGLLTTLCLLSISRRLFPSSPRLAWLATACVVLTPLYVMHFSTLNNGAWIAFFSAWITMLTLRANDEGRLGERRTLIIISVLLGLAFLVKLHAAALALFVAWIAWRHDSENTSLGKRTQRVALLAAGPVLIASWWYIRQIVLSGDLFPIQNHADFRPGLLRLGGYHPMAILTFLAEVLEGFFHGFGADNIKAPLLYGVPLSGLAVLTTCASVWRGSRIGEGESARAHGRAPVTAALLSLTFLLIALNISNIRYFHFHGRYFHSILAPLMLVFVAGFRTLFGKRTGAVFTAIVIWNVVFTLTTIFVILSHRYSIPASKLDRGNVVAYYDCGHKFFDQEGVGGFNMNQVQPELFTPRNTMRYAPQHGPDPEIRYTTDIPDTSLRYQVRLRYPFAQAGLDSGFTAAALLADSWLIHGPNSLWNFDEVIYALPDPVTNDGKVDIWWQNHLPVQANVACAELWIEEAWLSLRGDAELLMEGDKSHVSAVIQNIDSESAHVAHCFVTQGGRLLGEMKDIKVSETGSKAVLIPVTKTKADGGKVLLRLVSDINGPWATTKLSAWIPPTEAFTGRIEVPDLAVIRHTPTVGKPSDLVTVQLRRLTPGRYTLGITHPKGQDPLGGGHITLRSSEGASVQSGVQRRPAYYADSELQESFQILEKTRPGEKGSILITVHATNFSDGETLDIDRLIVRRLPDAESWGHSYTVRRNDQ